jgi:hypothetical protein
LFERRSELRGLCGLGLFVGFEVEQQHEFGVFVEQGAQRVAAEPGQGLG